ncbi:hypothetical protein A3H85_03725 [Candidatus Daviesbacteria bacterium RIFCSPLOWO2_02_FULL_40_8]|uniref:M23ase beta-sheet core domain-containing protein n=1 Tax=Candidatus Daviesbacteria bacterium RIFCSPLOWO2_01_FULL_40_24 TaxID=1797787 RepID=A0A1F5MK77_9BACT|nr:MAG: hypothetical protein A2780_00800 [Candidatus Daviesbacteria bacterium RIFCSPHIGHO2_01_FULL_41_45]OGE34038.1 MAG: hypothetical protein A3C32_00680 [Candidatus Daviesbacteria bacterium RIFCSPHIGHO2_02_FULL_41_14]OGE65774.1 MAG: hypothetical protein A3B49_04115 [Candidatus Daviesbacteria bacterium RIFCSPLOWO2_01_FULL_40_24]OGE66509.1 MAG: hypothetical protein A3H85_03725 [Candidatus Daviesbacteria bacterium RIFCSPLOWO2_02_FULL_40_8]
MRIPRTTLNSKHSSHLRSFGIGAVIIAYLLGYQPTFAIPPIKQSIIEANFTQKQTIQAAAFEENVNLPHPGYLTTSYTKWHPGVDIATGLGMPIRPILKGVVSEVTYSFWGLGHFVIIDHEQGYRSTYGHMGRIFVKKGDPVTTSSIIGEVGMTGWTSGPHTHLELSRNGASVDPQTIIPVVPNFNDYAKASPLPQSQPPQP